MPAREDFHRHLHSPSGSVDLLECYAVVLGLGFVGRYALRGETARRELMTALDTRIEALRPWDEPRFVIERGERRLSDWLYRASPWAIAGFACVAAALVWGVWTAALDAQLAEITPVTAGHR
ncbi:DotU family type IV/VI secretion system protein [Pandoraea norimbergensis]|uniref:DotU family type IV/VI secretion system protein n=1 Tax=Pandoraea norimbergensis TaxID=93219 RepID=UPI0009FF9B4B|nr:DotU family type IV/VI secretion system protein [Pandoraea norimbergensis]